MKFNSTRYSVYNANLHLKFWKQVERDPAFEISKRGFKICICRMQIKALPLILLPFCMKIGVMLRSYWMNLFEIRAEDYDCLIWVLFKNMIFFKSHSFTWTLRLSELLSFFSNFSSQLIPSTFKSSSNFQFSEL